MTKKISSCGITCTGVSLNDFHPGFHCREIMHPGFDLDVGGHYSGKSSGTSENITASRGSPRLNKRLRRYPSLMAPAFSATRRLARFSGSITISIRCIPSEFESETRHQDHRACGITVPGGARANPVIQVADAMTPINAGQPATADDFA